MDTFKYLISLVLDLTTRDAKRDDVPCHVSSGGSFRIVSAVLNKGLKPLCDTMHRGHLP
jgi:hypothetical protein